MRKTTKARLIYHQPVKKFLGTSIIPKNEMMIIHSNKNAELLTNYIAKKKKYEKDLKSLTYTDEINETKQKIKNLRKGSAEMRIKFIPFERVKKMNFQESLDIHKEQVKIAREKIVSDFEEKYGQDHSGNLTVITENWQSTSIAKRMYKTV